MIENTPTAWSERARTAATSHEAAMWSADGQVSRFRAVLAELDPQPGETLLDYGCGTGALSENLPPGVDYLGYDWAEGMIARACVEHHGLPNGPRLGFTSRLAQHPARGWDVAACVGAFNLRDGWSKANTWNALRWLWEHAGRALAVCLYSGFDPDCLTYTEAETAAFAATTGGAYLVTRHRKNDLLLVIRR